MSLSLSSLLNPEPPQQGQTSPPPPPPRRESLPPIQYVQSPEQHHATLPPTASPQQQRFTYPAATAEDAAQALASLSSSSAPPPAQYYGFSAPGYGYDEQRRMSEQRPGSGYGASVELPPPTADSRKMSSPTLDQYHVASRSPEQRRLSMISPAEAGFSLPPIQALNATQQEPLGRAQNEGSGKDASHAVNMQDRHALANGDQPALHRPAHTFDTGRSASTVSQLPQYSPPAPLKAKAPSPHAHTPAPSSSPAPIKQEAQATPEAASPSNLRPESSQQVDMDASTLKAVASLKNEHGLRTHSPLRETSMPVPTTETPPSEQVSIPKKRPAPTKKKGTATTAKKAPPAKKRKVEPKRSVTPSSRASKPSAFKTGSSKGTPANSSPAPSNQSYSMDLNEEADDDEDEMDDGDFDADGDVYCICRKPDNGTFMIGCDGTCDDWFHGKCVGIEERDKNLIDKYICPNCAKVGIGKTTWKRMCRRHGCRQPARVGRNKSGKDWSKYCSEECGVLFFREMVSRTRGREDTMKNRSSRRKNSVVSSTDRPTNNDDLGARGGVLSAGEVKGLIDSAKTAEDFKKLGEGVLSPPATPDGKSESTSSKGRDFNEQEQEALQSISNQKEEARRRHQLLKDRMKFVTMVKQAASRTAADKELKPKEYCGYDPRLEWSETRFSEWRESAVGRQAFELETLAVENSSSTAAATTSTNTDEPAPVDPADTVEAQLDVCDRKKCARHLEWPKLAVDDLRFEMSDNGDRMRALDKEEKEIRERAALRRKAGAGNAEGSVEVHGLGIVNTETGEEMDIDHRR